MNNYSSNPSQNSSTAVISLIAGILGFTFLPFIGSVIALITGSMAKREIAESRGTLGGEGLAQAGIILGWIGVALAVIGFCITGVIIVLPICLVALGLGAEEWGTFLPILFTFL